MQSDGRRGVSLVSEGVPGGRTIRNTLGKQIALPRRHPVAGSPRDNLQRSMKATFDESVWSHLSGTVSEPFALGDRQRVAVKVIDERGNELMRVLDVAE